MNLASCGARVFVGICAISSNTGGMGEVQKGQHLLIDCREVPRHLCLDDKLLLESLAKAAESAGSTVISQIRYKFGNDSPPGCTAIVMLDESHCSAHTYADLGLIALDIFTCGNTDPRDIWENLKHKLELKDYSVSMVQRFFTPDLDAQRGSPRDKQGEIHVR